MDQVDYGKVSAKSQVVIPKSVRQRLGLKQGDRLRFRVSDDHVMIEKVREVEDDPFATFSEWTSAEDDELYRVL
jgi:AbrB family looped-hinge helix DNA binding protein